MFRIIRLFRLDRILFQLLIGGSSYSFTDYFKGLENVEAVQRIFGARIKEILHNLKVEFTWIGGYMWVNGANGHLIISSRYLREGDKTEIYLDLIHELVHVKQFIDGKELFDESLSYVNRPTEIEAYRHAVEEAKRLGLNNEKICQYLRTEWMSQYDFERLAKVLRVKCSS